MASAYSLRQAFALLILLSKIAAATTTVWRNLPYIIGHNDIDVTPAIRRRIIGLSFDAIAGRRSFTFGASRASDYQLPHLDGVAKDHFALYFDSNDHALYLNNTSSERIHLSPAASIVLLTTYIKISIPDNYPFNHGHCRLESL